MDNAIGDIQITEVLKHKYKVMYNSVQTSDAEMQSLYSIVNNGIGISYTIFMSPRTLLHNVLND